MKGKSNMKVALCQINIEFENKEYNKKKIIAKVKEAKNNEANLCLFPEMTLTGFGWVKKINKSFYYNKL